MPFIPSRGGSSAAQVSLAPDWANSGEALTVAADWASTSAIGGATGSFKEDVDLGVRHRVDLDTDGSTPRSGARVQGLYHLDGCPEGDFVFGVRYSLDRQGIALSAATAGAYEAGFVFVDGDSVSTDPFYGFMEYWSGTIFTAHELYWITDAGGLTDKFESRNYVNLLTSPSVGSPPFDVFFVRSGTTLTVYLGHPGSIPQKVHSWTVSAGAGRIAMRNQNHGSDVVFQGVIHAFRSFPSVPW